MVKIYYSTLGIPIIFFLLQKDKQINEFYVNTKKTKRIRIYMHIV